MTKSHVTKSLRQLMNYNWKCDQKLFSCWSIIWIKRFLFLRIFRENKYVLIILNYSNYYIKVIPQPSTLFNKISAQSLEQCQWNGFNTIGHSRLVLAELGLPNYRYFIFHTCHRWLSLIICDNQCDTVTRFWRRKIFSWLV